MSADGPDPKPSVASPTCVSQWAQRVAIPQKQCRLLATGFILWCPRGVTRPPRYPNRQVLAPVGQPRPQELGFRFTSLSADDGGRPAPWRRCGRDVQPWKAVCVSRALLGALQELELP